MSTDLYRVIATVTRTLNGWTSSIQLPTFYVEAVSLSEAIRKARIVANAHIDADCVSLGVCHAETGDYQGATFNKG